MHHEDLRRGSPDWEPRELAADGRRQALGPARARACGSSADELPVPTVLAAPTPARPRRRKGDDPVTISGDVVELVLFLFGRSATGA